MKLYSSKTEHNNGKLRSIVLLACFALPLFFANPSAQATSGKKQAEQELKSLKAAIQKTQTTIKNTRKLQTAAESKLKIIDKALASSSKKLHLTRRTIKTKRSNINKLSTERDEKKLLISQQRTSLAAQLKSAYISGNQEYLKLLLNQQDPSKISRILQYYKYLNQARIKDINELQVNIARLLAVETEIQSSLDALQQLKQQQKKQQTNQLSLLKQQKSAIALIRKDHRSQTQQLEKQQADEKALQLLISSIEKSLKNFSPVQSLQGLSKLKNKLRWPVKGKLIHTFGSRKFEQRIKWSGIVISANSGSDVRAIHSGRVVFSDWLRGFGLLTIIDHGKGYLSLYGQNQSLFKTEGDWIEAGEPIATVGQSGGFGQPSLYFEIRYQGKPQNPVRWIK